MGARADKQHELNPSVLQAVCVIRSTFGAVRPWPTSCGDTQALELALLQVLHTAFSDLTV